MDYYYSRKRSSEALKHFNKETFDAWMKFDSLAFADGKLPKKVKELIAVGCAYITRCPYCIEGHTRRALIAGATKEEIAEVIAIAAAMNAGASWAHMNFALDVEE